MSTLSSPAPVASGEPDIRPFPYVEVSASSTSQGTAFDPQMGWSADLGGHPAGKTEDAAREASARTAALQEGEARARAAFEQLLAQEHEALSIALQNFCRERESYYECVEREVVQLALAIARKILYREAQVDPLLLAGIVRVALDKMKAVTDVVIRVHPHYAAEWRQFFVCRMETRDLPEVVEDPTLEPGRCTLETQLGTTDLGLEVQLKEIEHGLLDLMAQRPPANP